MSSSSSTSISSSLRLRFPFRSDLDAFAFCAFNIEDMIEKLVGIVKSDFAAISKIWLLT